MEDVVGAEPLRAFAGARVLVTGDTGFKGSWLSLWLAELGAEVHGCALAPTPEQLLYPALVEAGLVHHVDCDIRDANELAGTLSAVHPDFVFHLAAQALVRRSYDEPQLTFATNLLGSVNLLDAVRASPSVRALVYVTSDKCYLNKELQRGYREEDELGGRDPYSASKACAELAFRAYAESYYARRKGFGAASVRAGNVIGGGDRSKDRIVPDVIAALEAGMPVVLRNPKATRPWQHVLDPLYGYLTLAAALASAPAQFSGTWNFGPDEDAAHTVDELARCIVAVWGSGEIRHQPVPDAPHEATLLQLSSAKARDALGWHARWNFERTANEAARWYRAVRNGMRPLDVSRAQIAAYTAEVAIS